MAETINFGRRPTEDDIQWFIKNIGPRTHWLPYSIGGKGWKFTLDQHNPYSMQGDWYLTVNDGKMLTYWTLMK